MLQLFTQRCLFSSLAALLIGSAQCLFLQTSLDQTWILRRGASVSPVTYLGDLFGTKPLTSGVILHLLDP